MRTMRGSKLGLAGLALAALLVCGGPAAAQGAKNRIWVGDATELSVKEWKKRPPHIDVHLIEDQTNGKFGAYKIEKAIAWEELEGEQGVKITLDGVFADKVKGFQYEGDGRSILGSVRLASTKSSIQLPDLQATASGRAFEHMQLVVKTTGPALVKSEIIKNLGDQDIRLRFTILHKRDVKSDTPLTNFLEFSAETFDRPSTRPIVSPFTTRQQRYIQQTLLTLSEREDDDYVTAVYPARYADPNTLANLTRGRLSQLGRMDVDRNRSTIIITDRVRFTKNVLETMIALDRRPPQVTIVAQIVEINRSAGSRIGVDFNYLSGRSEGLKSANFNSSGLLGQGAILSGVYQNLSGKVLQQFAADINLMVQKRHAKVAAQPVLRVVNNSRGTFNSGERLPFFEVDSIDDTEQSRSRSTTNAFERIPGEDAPNKPSSYFREENTDNQFRERFNDRRTRRRMREIRTGVQLVVTPALRNSDEALLSINANYNELLGFAENGRPILSERRVDTRIRVRDGETVILAGLYRESEVEQTKGIPLLQDVPGLGKLFQTEIKRKDTYDIVFILTSFVQHD